MVHAAMLIVWNLASEKEDGVDPGDLDALAVTRGVVDAWCAELFDVRHDPSSVYAATAR
jgi:hypothetical protein